MTKHDNNLIFRIEIPLPLSVNQAYAGNKRRFKSKRYKEWLASLPRLEPMHINEPVYMVHQLFFPNRVNRDVGNYIKLAEDWLVSENILEDDNYKILKASLPYFGGIDKETPRSVISIYRIRESDIHLALRIGKS